jgi:hypothetical protein
LVIYFRKRVSNKNELKTKKQKKKQKQKYSLIEYHPVENLDGQRQKNERKQAPGCRNECCSKQDQATGISRDEKRCGEMAQGS